MDRIRLLKQYERVLAFMRLMAIHKIEVTLREIPDACHAPEASVSARLRDMRKKKFGENTLLARRSESPGVWLYRLMPDQEQGELF